MSQWLCSALPEADLPVICVETRYMQAVLKAQINKTDRNDARGIAQMMRVGLYRPVRTAQVIFDGDYSDKFSKCFIGGPNRHLLVLAFRGYRSPF